RRVAYAYNHLAPAPVPVIPVAMPVVRAAVDHAHAWASIVASIIRPRGIPHSGVAAPVERRSHEDRRTVIARSIPVPMPIMAHGVVMIVAVPRGIRRSGSHETGSRNGGQCEFFDDAHNSDFIFGPSDLFHLAPN